MGEWLQLKRMPIQALNELALDVCEGRVFTDQDLPEGEALIRKTVFLPLLTLTPEQVAEIEAPEVGMIYEYMKERGLAEVKGFPQFFTMKVLTKEDADIVKRKIFEFTQLRRQFLTQGVKNDSVNRTLAPVGEDQIETNKEDSRVLGLPVSSRAGND
jgi:hypothetical protein